MVLNLPWAVKYTIGPASVDKAHWLDCVDGWNLEEPETAKKYFLIVNIFGSYVIPLVVTITANVITWSRVKDRQVPNESTKYDNVQVMHQRTRRSVCTMLTIVTIAFFVAWTLYYIFLMAQMLFDIFVPESLYSFIVWMAWSTSSLNPILYGLLSSNFQKMFKNLLSSCCHSEVVSRNEH